MGVYASSFYLLNINLSFLEIHNYWSINNPPNTDTKRVPTKNNIIIAGIDAIAHLTINITIVPNSISKSRTLTLLNTFPPIS